MEQELSIDLNELNHLFSQQQEEEKDKPNPVIEQFEQYKEEERKKEEEGEEGLSVDLLNQLFSQEEKPDSKVKEEREQKKSSTSSEFLKAVAKDFYNEGLLEFDDEKEVEEVKDFEAFSKALAKTISKNELKDLTEEQRQYVRGVRAGVDSNEIISIQKNIKQLEGVDIEQLHKQKEWQKQLLMLDFEEKGIDEATAKTMVDTLSKAPTDELFKLSLKAKKDLEALYTNKINQKIKEGEAARQKELAVEEEKITKMKDKILKSEEIIPGLKLNEATKEEIWKSIVKPTSTKGASASPVNEVMEKYGKDENYRIALHTLHILTKGFTDFTNIEKKFQNKVTRNIDNFLENDRFTSGNTKEKSKDYSSQKSNSNIQREILNITL